jgi:hypothetical protein
VQHVDYHYDYYTRIVRVLVLLTTVSLLGYASWFAVCLDMPGTCFCQSLGHSVISVIAVTELCRTICVTLCDQNVAQCDYVPHCVTNMMHGVISVISASVHHTVWSM